MSSNEAPEIDPLEDEPTERVYEAIFRFSPQVIWIWDVETRKFLAANDAAVEVYGWSEEELRDLTINEIVPVDRAAEVDALAQALLTDSSPREYPMTTVSRRGDPVEMFVTSREVVFRGRRARMVVGTNVTEEIRLRADLEAALEAARLQERRLEALFEHSTEVVTISDYDGRISFVSGTRRSPLLLDDAMPPTGEDGLRFTHPDDQHVPLEMVEQARAAPGTSMGPVTYRMNQPGELDRWIETTWVDLTGRPEVGGVVAHTRDVTDRTLAERQLRDREERFRLLIEFSTESIMVIGPDGRLLYHTPNIGHLIGWDGDPSVTRDSFGAIHPEDRAAFDAAMVAARRADHQPVRIEVRVQLDGEWRTLDIILRDLDHLPSVGGLVFNIRDVTDRRRIEQRYVQAQKMEALGRLVGGVVHDFNNILTAVVGHAELLLDGSASTDPGHDSLQAILDSGMRAVDLTAQLLSVTRHRPVVPEVFDLNEAIRRIRPMLTPMLGDGVRLVTDLCTRPALIRADPGRLDQVLLNLILNARDALPRGGDVVIRTEYSDGGTEVGAGMEATTTPAGNPTVCLTVSDDGVGMTDAVIDHIFEPFFSTKDEGLGSGLGLATVYGVVEQAGGRIEVESQVGTGTVFSIFLPASVAIADPTGGAPASPVDIHPAGSTVLVVEDEDLVRSLAVLSMRRAGFSVVEAESVAAAVAIVADTAQVIDLVITDVVLADGRASQLVARLDELRPEVPVLHVSGYALDAMVQSGEMDEGVEFLAKPYRPVELIDRASALLGLVVEPDPAGGVPSGATVAPGAGA